MFFCVPEINIFSKLQMFTPQLAITKEQTFFVGKKKTKKKKKKTKKLLQSYTRTKKDERNFSDSQRG